MSNIKFVSHEEFPEDPYTKELVYLCIDEKYRIAYTRREGKNGGSFWSVGKISTLKDGMKSYHDAFIFDSAFLEKDIKKFLDDRSWEAKAPQHSFGDEEIPF